MDPALVQTAYEDHATDLKRYLLSILRDDATSEDALQDTFETFMQKGDSVAIKSTRAWLFRVAYQKAMLVKRKSAMRTRNHEKIAWRLQSTQFDETESAESSTILREDSARVTDALGALSENQKTVVKMRIHDGLKFREIAEELNLPLGTVLTRMRSALQKLRNELEK